MVDKNDLMRQVWPDTVVEESNITVAISALRKALGETPATKWIATIPGRGYSFVGLAASQPLRSVAILEFSVLNQDGRNEYLGVGLTDAVITRLSNMPLIVRPLASVSRFAGQDPIQAGRDLGVVVVDGDLGRIVAGDSETAKTPGLKSLAVESLGELGTLTQAPGGTIMSRIEGSVGKLTVRTNVREAVFRVTAQDAAANGKLGAVTIGADVIGGTGDDTGVISSSGTMGPVTIGGPSYRPPVAVAL